jgi:murein DD-endopeptidase MepM/ murein hydrolase activator NlpD
VKSYSGGIRHDYKSPLFSPGAIRRRHWAWFAAGLLVPIVAVAIFVAGDPHEAEVAANGSAASARPTLPEARPPAPAHEPSKAGKAIPLELPSPSTAAADANGAGDAQAQEEEEQTDAAPAMLDLIVHRGESLDTLFRRNGLSLADLSGMIALADAGKYLKLVRPGDEIRIFHRDSEVLTLMRELDDVNLLTIGRTDSGFEASVVQRDVERRTVSAHGVIKRSLFDAAKRAGMSDNLTMEMAGVFQWDIDFIQDVRVGDEFTVIYDELWRDGVKLKNGDVVAAEFINQGRPFRAVRYVDHTGHADYFTPEGRSVRKAFIRAPVDFTRISSTFSLNRRHPILNKIRAHRGVDYAAPTGTPIKAAGDGKVVFRGVKGGYGRTVILQHGSNITTLYGHMSRFAKPRVGSRVKQGQVIGYVGMSGLATGPHLHYEYRINGVHRNPRTVPLPPAEPVPTQDWDDFQRTAAVYWHQLDLYQQVGLTTAAN